MTQSLLKIILLGTFVLLFTALIAMMPDAQPLPSGISDLISIIFSSLRTFNFILPIDTLFFYVGLSFIAEAAMYIIRLLLQLAGMGAKLVQGS